MTRRLSLRREDIYQDLFTENSDESDVASDDSSGAESSEKDDLPVETDIQDDLESSEEEENHLNVNSPKETQASLLTRSRTVDMSSASMIFLVHQCLLPVSLHLHLFLLFRLLILKIL